MIEIKITGNTLAECLSQITNPVTYIQGGTMLTQEQGEQVNSCFATVTPAVKKEDVVPAVQAMQVTVKPEEPTPEEAAKIAQATAEAAKAAAKKPAPKAKKAAHAPVPEPVEKEPEVPEEPVKEEPKAIEPVEEKAPEKAENTPSEPVSSEACKTLLVKYRDVYGVNELAQLLRQFGAAKYKELKPEQYPEIMAIARAELEKRKEAE